MANLNEDILDASKKVLSSNDALDYSPQSISIVEAMLSEASDFVNDMPLNQVENIIQNFGCYILEVARRQFKGRFAWNEKQKQPVFITGEPQANIAIMTWDKVKGRLSGDEGDNINYFYDGFVERSKEPKPGENILFV